MAAVYERLLRLYPASYRAAFAGEMAEVFRESERDARSLPRLDRVAFYLNEYAGLAAGAIREQLHAAGQPRGWQFFGSRSLYMQPERKFSKVAIVFMCLAFAIIVETIIKGQGIAAYIYQVYTANGHVVIETRQHLALGNSLSTWPSHYGLVSCILTGFVIAWIVGAAAWVSMNAMRRSGAQRMDDLETWPPAR